MSETRKRWNSVIKQPGSPRKRDDLKIEIQADSSDEEAANEEYYSSRFSANVSPIQEFKPSQFGNTPRLKPTNFFKNGLSDIDTSGGKTKIKFGKLTPLQKGQFFTPQGSEFEKLKVPFCFYFVKNFC